MNKYRCPMCHYQKRITMKEKYTEPRAFQFLCGQCGYMGDWEQTEEKAAVGWVNLEEEENNGIWM